MRGDRNLTDQILAAEGMVGLATRGALPWPREARGANIDRRALSRVIDGLRRENVSKTRTAWLAAVQALVVSARPDLAEQFEAYLGADPLVDEGSRGSNPLRGMTIGEIGVVYEALLALSNRRNRKARGQYFTPDDVAAFMAQQAAKFPEGTWLDPCCGVGNLSWHLAAAMDAPGDFVKHRLALVDIDLVALKTATALIVASFAPPEDRTVLPSLSERATAVDYLGNKPVPGHDFVLMNPPYAATAVRRSFRTGKTRDTFAYFLERASTAKGLVAITPASYLSAAKYAPVREVVDEREGGDVYVFDNVPDTVFRGFKYGSANTSQTTARQFNAGMPEYSVSRVEEVLGDLNGKDVVVLGASYRGGVKETAFSGVFETVDQLRKRGANVKVQDPMYSAEEIESFGWKPYTEGDAVDAVIVQADHAEYKTITPQDFPGIKLLFDGRRVTDPELWVGTPRIVIGA